MWLEKMKKIFENKTIEGRNLGEAAVNFDKLSSMFTDDQKREKEIVEKFERIMISMFENSDDIDIEQMQVKGDSVVIEEGTTYHTCPLRMESLEGISQGGLLCSEWFGSLESEGEGRFCAFLSTTTDKFKTKPSDSFTLCFDTNNPLMKFLLKNDFFEYSKRKKDIKQKLFDSLSEEEKTLFYKKAYKQADLEMMEKSKFWRTYDEKTKAEKLERMKGTFIQKYSYLLPQNLNEKTRTILKEEYEYDDLILDLFDKVIEPLSPAGLRFHDDEEKNTYYWRAIPGGIPSSLINGIQINTNLKEDLTNKEIEQIQKMFPKAVIFDENKRVIAKPLKVVR